MHFLLALSLFAATGEDIATICVALKPPVGADSTPPLEIDDLLAALDARIARRRVRVTACAANDTASWRVSVLPKEGGHIQVRAHGEGLAWEGQVPTAGLAEHEVVQTIALRIAEEIRAPVEALLFARLQPKHDAVPAPPVSPPVVECPDVDPPPAPPPPEILMDPTVSAGVGYSIGPAEPFGHLEIGGGVDVGAVELWGFVGGSKGANHNRRGIAAASEDFEAGVDVLMPFAAAEIGAGIRTRLTFLRLAGVGVRSETSAHWNAGLTASAAVWLWRSNGNGVGLTSRAWVWTQPRRFLVNGAEVAVQPTWQLYLGPIAQLDI